MAIWASTASIANFTRKTATPGSQPVAPTTAVYDARVSATSRYCPRGGYEIRKSVVSA